MMMSMLAACSGKEEPAQEPETEEVAEEVVEEEPKNPLAGTSYVLTEFQYENENGEMVDEEVDPKKAPSFDFNEDGTYTETYHSPDLDSGDLETLYEKKRTGKYEIIDGNQLKITADPEENADAENAEEANEAVKQMEEYIASITYTIEGDTITQVVEGKEITAEDSVATIPGRKMVYTKTN
jgi:hypothetical protein